MRSDTAYLGNIVNTVGLKGEVKLLPSSDFWVEALDVEKLDLVSRDGVRRIVHIDRYRIRKNVFIIKFSGIEDIDEAESIMGDALEISVDALDERLLPRELKPFQVKGVEVFKIDGTPVGTVTGILSGPQQDCLIVEKNEKRCLVPNVPEVVKLIDLDRGVIEIDPPEGLLDLTW
ncbi:MAG: 16S rRNA processing protein RimM [Candidatus Krumholzibacteriota bacterium]|nr:16S rRNA processing protein RimM [Candidatus Krumholzibacteriota bacterium]